MDRFFPWQRQLCECERLICQREAALSEVRDREGTDLPLAAFIAPAVCGKSPPWSGPWPSNPDQPEGFSLVTVCGQLASSPFSSLRSWGTEPWLR